MSAVTSKVVLEHSTGWAENHPDYALKSIHNFHNSYSKDYEISIDTSRSGFIQYVAELKEKSNDK